MAVHRQHLDAARLRVRLQNGVVRHHHLQAAFGQIGRGLHDVAIRYLGDAETGGLHEIIEGEFGDAGNHGGIELAGFGARIFREVRQRADLERCRNPDSKDGVGHTRDRHQVLGYIGQL